MAILLIVAVSSVAFLVFCEFAQSREAKPSKEHRALVLKLRQRIARKRNRRRMLFFYRPEDVNQRKKEYESRRNKLPNKCDGEASDSLIVSLRTF